MKRSNSITKASVIIKPIFSVISSIAKGKWGTLKTKTESIKAKLIIFSLIKPKNLPALGSITNKIHAVLGSSRDATISEHQQQDQLNDDDQQQQQQQQMVEYYYNSYYNDDEDGDDKYPDLRHCLFDEEEEEDEDPNASVIDQVRNIKEEEGHDFKLEDEIDHVADLFINKVHKRMRIQKLQSFKRYQAMISRST